MKAATVHDIKQELIRLQPAKLTEICLRLAKFKKENKELLSYLLFEAGDENGYIHAVKNEMDEMFDEINHTNIYYTKKTLRKILRVTNKHIRYISGKTAEVELIIYFLQKIREAKIPLQKSVLLANIYNGQQKKVEKLITGLHEDLQHDYLQQMESI
ncbi:MAG: hypothetical protein EOO04_23330 [Chitinophagaceae bacterium]|nr:MAG: hypothetical protein EOO04_23330 [Chitinophagaceae bacterium]